MKNDSRSPLNFFKVCLSLTLILSVNQAVSQVVPYTADANTVLLDHFNGATSATISAYNNNGAPLGTAYPSATPSYSFGQGGNGLTQALTLNPPSGMPAGSGTYLNYPGGQLLSQSNGTIEFWVYVPSFGTGLNLIQQGQYFNAAGGWTFGMSVDATGQLSATAWAAFSMNSGTTHLSANTWNHVAATWGSSGAKLYINGVMVGNDPNTGMPASGWGGSILMLLGTHTGISSSIDELRVSNIQRTTFNASGAAYVPTITSFIPSSGPVGTSVLISGTNFNANSTKNVVYFGGVKAPVTSGTTTGLTVNAPAGATYAPISVTDTTTGLTVCSNTLFNVIFPTSRVIDGTTFSSKVDFTAGTNPWAAVIGDIDGDGKPDLVVTNCGSGTISIYRNISSSGTITSSSFAAKVDFTTGVNPYGISIGDIDGDGKLDIVVANGGTTNTISVLRNTSTPGSITTGSLAAKVDFVTGSNPYSVAIGDVDGDGKPDLAVTNNYSNTVSIFRNTSTPGSISAGSFASKVDFTTGATPAGVAIGDIDGDGKPDLVFANANNNSLSVYRNTSTSGSITAGSFASRVDFAAGTSPQGNTLLCDIDGDGKLDVVITNFYGNNVSVFRNNSTTGLITTGSFDARVDLGTGTGPRGAAVADIDGDGKPDLVFTVTGSNSISVFRNIGTAGSITSSSFGLKVDFATGINPNGIAISDFDGDGKPDVATLNYSANSVSVLRNAMGTVNLPPAAPQNLIVIAGNAQVTLKWNKNTEADFLKYRIYRGIASGGETLVDSSSASKTDTTRTLVSLTNGTAYYFRVTAIDSARLESLYSNEVFGTPSNNFLTFQANMRTAIRKGKFISASDSVIVRGTYNGWTANTDRLLDPNADSIYTGTFNVGVAAPTEYKFAIRHLGADNWERQTNTNRTYTLTGNPQTLSVVYFDDDSTTNSAPATPRNLQAVAGVGQAILKWNKNSEADFLKYRVYMGVDSNTVVLKDSSSNSISDTSKTITGLTNGTKYYFRVSALDSARLESAQSYASSVTPSVVVPSAPTGLTASAVSSSQINLNWTASAIGSPTLYRIFRSLTSGTGFSKIDSVSGLTTTYSNIAGLSASTTYYYLVYAVNAGGQSAASNQATATTLAGAVAIPSAPTGLSATAVSSSQINLSWTASSTGNPTLYRIFRSLTSGIGFAKVDSVTGSTTTYSNIVGLSATTTYYYMVYAVNAGGQSVASNQAMATTQPVAATVPSAPTGLTATDVSSSQINLSWTASSTGSPTLYRIFRSLTSGTGFSKIDSVPGTTSYSNTTGLTANTMYYYLVYAVNAFGQSAPSNQASALTSNVTGSITVTTPSSNWATTFTHGINWSSQNVLGNVNIKLSLDKGSTYSKTIVAIVPNSGSYSWSIPSNQTTSGSCILKVESATNPAIFGISGVFAIVDGGSVTFGQPMTVIATYSQSPTSNAEYRLISFPGNVSNVGVGQVNFSGIRGDDWKMFREPGNGPGFVEMYPGSTMKTGEGYWFIQKGPLSMDVSFTTPPLNNDATVTIMLTGGPYSIIANPFNVTIPWSSVLAANGLPSNTPLFSWKGSWSSSNTSLEPGVGYYFNSTGLTTLKMPCGPFGFPSQVAGEVIKPEWQLQLAYESETNKDDDNYIGIAAGACQGKDRFEFNKPPLIFDESFAYMKRTEWDNTNDIFYSDYRPEIGGGQTWDFDVTNPSKSLGCLSLIGVEKVPLSYNVYLVNEETGVAVNARQQSSIQYGYGRTSGHFKVVVGPDSYIGQQLESYTPKEFILEQNYPNPFNPSTTVLFKMPKAASVRLEVFTMLGQKVKVLAEGWFEAGTHQAVWMGDNDRGARVASGVYFCRFISGKNLVQTRKMLLTK